VACEKKKRESKERNEKKRRERERKRRREERGEEWQQEEEEEDKEKEENEEKEEERVSVSASEEKLICSTSDVLRFFAVWLVMGLVQQPTIEHHWKTDFKAFGNAWIQETMSLKCFLKVSRHLRWPDPPHTGVCDKVLELEEKLNCNFKSYFLPKRICVVDEIMLLFKGRFKYRQHVRGKPKATGLKIYGIADENGYLWNFFMYRGHSQTILKTVWSLIASLPYYYHLGYLIIADSFFGGYDLALLCAFFCVDFIFACKNDRPSFLFSEKSKTDQSQRKTKLKKNEWITRWKELSGEQWTLVLQRLRSAFQGNPVEPPLPDEGDATACTTHKDVPIAATSWVDRKKVNFLHSVDIVGSMTHKKRDVPSVSRTYNDNMGQIDQFDVYLQQHLCPHRSCRWTRTLILGLFKATTVNAFKIYHLLNGDDPYGQFLLSLADELVEQANKLDTSTRLAEKILKRKVPRSWFSSRTTMLLAILFLSPMMLFV